MDTSIPPATLSRVRPPRRDRPPLRLLLLRVVGALLALVVVAVTVLVGRDGWSDETGGTISLLDALYYASVSVTTTGYGDITPVTPGARLSALLIILPARVTFLLLVVGTTIELLTERWRETWQHDRWRQKVENHYVICGYGVKGRSAARVLTEGGVDPARVVVVEPDPATANEAARDGYAVATGDASRDAVLSEVHVDRAKAVIVAADRDDATVLITLTARRLAPDARIVAAVREAENAPLLEQSGADTAITSSETSGRLLGISSRNPRVGALVEDLLHTDVGLSLAERSIGSAEVGRNLSEIADRMVLAVVRGEQLMRHDDPEIGRLQAGDRLIGLPVNNGD